MSDKLRECPFCGHDASMQEEFLETEGHDLFYVTCIECDALSSVHREGKYAVKAWNIRHEPKHETAIIDSLLPAKKFSEDYVVWSEKSLSIDEVKYLQIGYMSGMNAVKTPKPETVEECRLCETWKGSQRYKFCPDCGKWIVR